MRLYAISVYLLLASAFAFAADQRGEWTMAPGSTPDTVTFSVQYSNGRDHHDSSSSKWSKSSFVGVDFKQASKHDVRFSIARDGGTIDCQGFLESGEGAGLFTFHPNPEYGRQMAAVGFEGMSDDKLLAASLYDVSLSFARSMQAEHLAGLDTNKLLACRIFHVTPDYIHKLQSHGLQNLTIDKILALRIQGIN